MRSPPVWQRHANAGCRQSGERCLLAAAWLAASGLFAAARPGLTAAEAFTAVFAGGDVVTGAKIEGWHGATPRPTLAGRELLPPERPLRALWFDSRRGDGPPRAFVELVLGDVLPGHVVAWSAGYEGTGGVERPGPYLLVEPLERLDWPGGDRRSGIRVLPEWVRRVAWERRADDRLEPGTVFLRDGRRMRFRALRWTASAVVVLGDGGTTRLAFTELAEIHTLPPAAWEAYFAEIAVLAPSCAASIVQVSAGHGLRVTTSTERFAVHEHGGGPEDPASWLQVVQPAWSIDALWLRFADIDKWLYFRPEEVPLSAVGPERVTRSAVFGGAWSWRSDRNVYGEPLRSGGRTYGWGLGVQATASIAFALPAGALRLEGAVGLDDAVADGGCARAAVYVACGPERNRLFTSGLLAGSSRTMPLAGVDLGAALDAGPLREALRTHGAPELVLEADMAEGDGGGGRDIYDIRDAVDWLEPILVLDPGQLRAQVRARWTRGVPAWAGWTLAHDDAKSFLLRNHWSSPGRHDKDRGGARWDVAFQLAEGKVALSRPAAFPLGRKWVLAEIDGVAGGPAVGRLEVAIDGRTLASAEARFGSGGAGPPLEVHLPPAPDLDSVRVFEPRLTVTLERPARGRGEAARPAPTEEWLVWRKLRILDRPPGVVAIFEDTTEILSGVAGVVSLEGRAALHGAASLRLDPRQVSMARAGGLRFSVRKSPAYGEYRFLCFAWRKEGGGDLVLELEADLEGEAGGSSRLRYDCGGGVGGARRRIRVSSRAPQEWELVTRDLVADWGEHSLSGIEFSSRDGDAAFIDHVYLARSLKDLEAPARMPVVPRAVWNESMKRPLGGGASARGDLIDRMAPGFELIVPPGGGAEVIAEHLRRPGVLRTRPGSAGTSCVLRSRQHPPAGRGTWLFLSVAHDLRGGFALSVRGNGRELYAARVDPASTPAGWLDAAVDLSAFAGGEVVVDVLSTASGRPYELAYWWLVHVESEAP